MASGHVSRIKRPNTWLHRPMLQNVKKALANPEPSTRGTFRTSRNGQRRSVVGVKRTSRLLPPTSDFDAVDGSSTGTCVPCIRFFLRA